MMLREITNILWHILKNENENQNTHTQKPTKKTTEKTNTLVLAHLNLVKASTPVLMVLNILYSDSQISSNGAMENIATGAVLYA